MRSFLTIATLLFLFLSKGLFAQEPQSYNFNNTNGLPTNEVYACYETEDGKLYIAHDLGLSVYDGRNFELITPKGVKEGESCFGMKISNGKLWFKYSNKRLYYLEDDELLPYEFNKEIGRLKYSILYDFEFTDDSLFLLIDDGYFTVDNQGRINQFNKKTNNLIIDLEAKIMKRFVPIINDTFQMHFAGKKFQVNSMGSIDAHYGKAINSDSIYFNKDVIYLIHDNKIRTHTLPPLKGNKYHSSLIVSVQLIDSLLFVSTRTKGVNVFKIKQGKLEHQFVLLKGKFAGIISKGKSGLWVPEVKGGLHFFPNYKIKNFKTRNKVRHLYPHKNGLFYTSLNHVDKDPINVITNNQIIPIDTFKLPLFLKEFYKEKFKSFGLDKLGVIKGLSLISSHPIAYRSPQTFVYETKELFVKANGAFISFHSRTDQKSDTVHLKGLLGTLRLDDANYIVYGEFGLNHVEIKNNLWNSTNLIQTKNRVIETQFLDQDHIAFATTENIFKFNLKSGKYDTIYSNHQSSLKCFLKDDDLLFIGTKSYMEVFDLEHNSSYIFNNSNGLKSSNIEEIRKFKDTIVLATETGVSFIPISLIREKLKTKHIDYNDKLQISPDREEIFVAIKVNQLNPLVKVYAQYSLNKGEFIDFNPNKLTLSNLKSGEYAIRVRLKFGNEKWIYLEERFFEVPSPFYSRWWFSASIVAFIALVAIFIIRRRNKITTQRLKTEKLIETLRMNALTSQMNPHFLYNALNTIQGLLSGDKKKVFMYVSDLARFFRLMLNNSSDLYIPIQREIELNQIFCEVESVRQFREVDLQIIYEKEEFADFIIPSMILQPFVENALWHAFTKEIDEPKIEIRISELDENTLIIQIEDNGIGIDNTKNRKKVHQSKGVSIVENRLKIFNESNPNISKNIKLTDLKNTDNAKQGTLIEVYLTKQRLNELQDHNH